MGWAGYLGSDSSERPSQVAEAAVQLGLGAREIEDVNGWAAWWHSSHHHLGVSGGFQLVMGEFLGGINGNIMVENRKM